MSMPEPETLAARVKRVLTEYHLTQTGLAKTAKISRGTIGGLLAGRRQISPPAGQLLTEALDKIEGLQPADAAPALLYLAVDGSRHRIDADEWDPQHLAPRELAMCRALLDHALARLSPLNNHPLGGEPR